MRAIHLINRRDGAGLFGMMKWPEIEHGFKSCCWQISEEQAASLVGGWVYFHETKGDPARFGGQIIGFEQGSADLADRKIILLRADARARGQRWRGAAHGMAMWSGLVDADAEHELG